VKSLKMCQSSPGEYPSVAAIKEDGLDYCLVEFGGNRWRNILTPKNLPNLSPGGADLLELSTVTMNDQALLGIFWLNCEL
jgi:hypothetical protein